MAKFLSAAKTIVLTDGGETVVDQEFTWDMEVDELFRSTVTIASGDSVVLCVKGTDLVGPPAIVDPLVLPVSQIRGYSIYSDVQLGIKEDGAATEVQGGPGEFGKDNCTLDTLELLNSSGLPSHAKVIVWGDR